MEMEIGDFTDRVDMLVEAETPVSSGDETGMVVTVDGSFAFLVARRVTRRMDSDLSEREKETVENKPEADYCCA